MTNEAKTRHSSLNAIRGGSIQREAPKIPAFGQISKSIPWHLQMRTIRRILAIERARLVPASYSVRTRPCNTLSSNAKAISPSSKGLRMHTSVPNKVSCLVTVDWRSRIETRWQVSFEPIRSQRTYRSRLLLEANCILWTGRLLFFGHRAEKGTLASAKSSQSGVCVQTRGIAVCRGTI